MSKTAILEQPTALVPAVPQVMTPPALIERAIAQGAGIEIIEKLMALQERWDANNARKDFDAAVAAAKAEIKPVIKTKNGHNSRYADFATIARAVDPIITKHGLSYRFRTTQDERIHVTCVLSHRAGHCETTTLAGPPDKTGNKNDIQAIGSTLTYLQRYSLVQALGLAASDDDDGKAADTGNVVTDEQAEQIRKLLTETKSDLTKFLKYIGAESVSDISASKFKNAVAALETKRGKQ